MLARHEALRTVFTTVEGQPRQTIHPAESLAFTLPVTDLAGLAAAEQELKVQELITAAAQRPFDLAAGPLLRASIVRLAEQTHVLVLVMHHIVSDGWSMGVFVGELVALYEAARSGQPAALPALPVQYADYAAWQRQMLAGEVLQQELAWWRQELAQLPAELALPLDHPRPPVQTYRGRQQAFSFPVELSDGLAGPGPPARRHAAHDPSGGL